MYQSTYADMYKCVEIRKNIFSKFYSGYIWEMEVTKQT